MYRFLRSRLIFQRSWIVIVREYYLHKSRLKATICGRGLKEIKILSCGTEAKSSRLSKCGDESNVGECSYSYDFEGEKRASKRLKSRFFQQLSIFIEELAYRGRDAGRPAPPAQIRT